MAASDSSFRLAQVMFMVGAVPVMILGLVFSLVVPQGSFAAWLAFAGGWQVQLVLIGTVVCSFLAGLIVALPFFVFAVVRQQRKSRGD